MARTLPRIAKAQITAAYKELECIHEFATENGNFNGACLRRHALTASRQIEVLVRSGHPLPEWTVKNIRFLQAMGWHFDYAYIKATEAAR